MSEIETRTFDHTAAALIVFESTVTQRARAWATADSVDDIVAAERADIEALHFVQAAFYQDTRDINSFESCMRMGLASLRRLTNGAAPFAPIIDANDGGGEPGDTEDTGETAIPAPR